MLDIGLCLCLQLKLNTDESPGIATEYGIRSIPTVMIFKDGVKQVRRRVLEAGNSMSGGNKIGKAANATNAHGRCIVVRLTSRVMSSSSVPNEFAENPFIHTCQETVIGAVPKSTLSQTIDKYVD